MFTTRLPASVMVVALPAIDFPCALGVTRVSNKCPPLVVDKQLVFNALTMLCSACMLGYVAMLGATRAP